MRGGSPRCHVSCSVERPHISHLVGVDSFPPAIDLILYVRR